MAGPLIDRLAHIGGPTTARAAALMADPLATKRDHTWATCVFAAHQAALELQASFTPPELLTLGLIAPRGSLIPFARDTWSVVMDLPPSLYVEFTPSLQEAARAPKGVRFVAAGLRRMGD